MWFPSCQVCVSWCAGFFNVPLLLAGDSSHLALQIMNAELNAAESNALSWKRWRCMVYRGGSRRSWLWLSPQIRHNVWSITISLTHLQQHIHSSIKTHNIYRILHSPSLRNGKYTHHYLEGQKQPLCIMNEGWKISLRGSICIHQVICRSQTLMYEIRVCLSNAVYTERTQLRLPDKQVLSIQMRSR